MDDSLLAIQTTPSIRCINFTRWNCVEVDCKDYLCTKERVYYALNTQKQTMADGRKWYSTRIWRWYYNMAKRLRLNYAQKYTILTQCKLMNVTGGRGDMMKVAEWAVSALNLPSPPSHNTMLCMLREEDTITAWMDSHAFNRKKKWCNRNNIFD